MGPSGSGKSTLLHLIAAMDRPTGGEIRVLGQDLRALKRPRHRALAQRARRIHLPVVQPDSCAHRDRKRGTAPQADQPEQEGRMDLASTALRLVGLGNRLGHLPRQLSGGQEQRVAIARAIVTDPDLILADEPTGNLDAASAQEVLPLLAKLNREYDKSIVMVTHDPHAAQVATKIRHLEKGALLPEGQAELSAGAIA
jgi:putative ABC transport system ATP-binding protein